MYGTLYYLTVCIFRQYVLPGFPCFFSGGQPRQFTTRYNLIDIQHLKRTNTSCYFSSLLVARGIYSIYEKQSNIFKTAYGFDLNAKSNQFYKITNTGASLIPHDFE